MKKSKFILIGLMGLLAFSSCGIFKKGCDCPVFRAYRQPVKSGMIHS